ncbi:MAG TPA: HEAT repeat domain-containing protein [Candidatus Binatia bacterium]|nr:HEAT repeat domain-containing protein [Candidatus Binatia bacterium]
MLRAKGCLVRYVSPPRLILLAILHCAFAIAAGAQVNVGTTDEDPNLCSGLTTVQQCLVLHHIALTKDALLSALHSQDTRIKILAAEGLAVEDVKDAIPDLTELLEAGSEPNVRMILAQSLARLGDGRGVEILRSYCNDASVSISDRLTAASTLLDFQPKSCPETLVAGLQSDIWEFRVVALGMIPNFKQLTPGQTAQVRAILLRSLFDQAVIVRKQAAVTMWELGDKSFIPALQAALGKEAEPIARHAMEYSLKRLQSPGP